MKYGVRFFKQEVASIYQEEKSIYEVDRNSHTVLYGTTGVVGESIKRAPLSNKFGKPCAFACGDSQDAQTYKRFGGDLLLV